VVSYMVRSVDYILKNKFQIPKGLADAKKITIKNPNNSQETQEVHQVLILDPAVGTGTFLHSVIDHIYDSFRQQKGMWSSSDRGTSWLNSLQHKLFGVFERKSSMQITPHC